MHLGTLHRDHQRRHRASLGSIAASVAVLGIFALYAWSTLQGEPEVAPMDASARLAALQQARVEAARRVVARPSEPVAAAATVASPIPPPVEIAAARLEEAPVQPQATPVERTTALEPGATLEAALAGLYVHGDAARQVAAAYRTLADPRRLQPGTRLLARFDSASPLDAYALRELVVAPTGKAENVTIRREGEGAEANYRAEPGGVPGELVRRVLRCGIRGSLSASLTRCGHDDALIGKISAVLAERLDLERDLRVGDELRVVFDELVAAGERVRIEDVLAIDYRGALGRHTALRFEAGDVQGWFRPDGEGFASFFLREPVPGARFTSGFGMRMHPILLKMKPHLGIDLAAPTGTPVRAVADGKVAATGKGKVAGRYIKLRHDRGYGSDYLHLSRVAIRGGAKVHRGQIIGYVGTSGRSTAPHLHLGIRKGGAHVDPIAVRDEPAAPVPTRHAETYRDHAATLMRLLDAVDPGKDDA